MLDILGALVLAFCWPVRILFEYPAYVGTLSFNVLPTNFLTFRFFGLYLELLNSTRHSSSI